MSEKPNGPEEKKVFVDEDWKTQVEEERERLKQQSSEPEAEPQQEAPTSHGPLPPPGLEFVVSSFAMQAMMAMGVIANPVSGKAEARLDEAKHFIDTVQLLQAKTEGNRTPEETAMIESILHELRMAYVALREQPRTPSS
jgi:hypothetical protein